MNRDMCNGVVYRLRLGLRVDTGAPLEQWVRPGTRALPRASETGLLNGVRLRAETWPALVRCAWRTASEPGWLWQPDRGRQVWVNPTGPMPFAGRPE